MVGLGFLFGVRHLNLEEKGPGDLGGVAKLWWREGYTFLKVIRLGL